MKIPGLGEVTKDADWYRSQPLKVSLLGGMMCSVIVEGYDHDANQNDFHIAIANLLSSPNSILIDSQQYIYRYYLDMNSEWETTDDEYVSIATPDEVWNHIQLGNEPLVVRRAYGDKAVYVSIECNCDWEVEHGLQLVFKNGNQLVKVGPYDGHLTNADAYADPTLENVIYR